MMKFRFQRFVNISAGLMATVLIYSCASGEKKATENGEKPIGVTTSLPIKYNNSGFEVSGKVESSQNASISTRMMGYITDIKVKVGDKVQKGQLLVTIDSRDIQAHKGQADAMVAEAEAAFANAQKDLERFTALYEQKSATAKELENITFQHQSAKSHLEAARQMRNEANATMSYAQVVAPFTGVITQKYMDAGSMATPGMPILSLEGKEGFQVTATIPETEIGKMKMGDEVQVTIKTIDKSFKAIINEISSSSLTTGGQFLIRIHVSKNEEDGLLSGQYANVSMNGLSASEENKGQTLLVPASSIIYNDQLTGIYTISSFNTALLRWIRLGKSYGANVEVLTGLGGDEKFVLKSESKLWNGAPVVESSAVAVVE